MPSITKADALAYKSEVMNNVIRPLNQKSFDSNREVNLRFFTKHNPHLFGRVLERGIDKKVFTSIFELLFKNKYDELLEICKKDKAKMNSTDSVAVFVRYKGVSVVFIFFDDTDREGFFSMMPLTVLAEYEYKKCNYEIELG